MSLYSTIKYQPYDTNCSLVVEIHDATPQTIDCASIGQKKRCMLVADRNVMEFAGKVRELWDNQNFITSMQVIDVNTKSLEVVTSIWEGMIGFHPDFAVAIGGGTTCDLTGFAASCYRRGIPVVLFPTTLLAISDVCISGKTGIDFCNIKNSIGTIHYPRLAVCVLDVLRTLSMDDFRSGLAEIVKVAVTSSSTFFDQLEQIAPRLVPGVTELVTVVETSCRLKATLVESNPQIRLHSLYGHVVGQALEGLCIGVMRHGDCVAIGINIEGYIAMRLGLWSEADWRRQARLLQMLMLPQTIPPHISVSSLLQHMLKDKHSTPTTVNLILPEAIGAVHMKDNVSLTPIPIEVVGQYLDECTALIEVPYGSRPVEV